MEESFVASSKYIEQQAVRAVAALASPAWTAHIIGTAAALVAENAKKICAQQIIHQVMSLGLNSHTTCCFPFCAFVMTTWRSTYRAMQNYTCCTCWPAMLGRTMFTSCARCMNTHTGSLLQVPLLAPKLISKQLEQALQAAVKCMVTPAPCEGGKLNGRIQSSQNSDSPG